MTPVPLELPLRPSDAAAVANLIFDQAERRPLTEELRNRLAGRAAVLRLTGLTPYFGSLERDPVHPSTYYLAVDGAGGQSLLLHMALANAPTSSLFAKLLLVGRMPRPFGPEMVINCLPFGPGDRENIEKFASVTDARLLPRPLGPRPAIVVESDRPEQDFPAALEAFRAVHKRTGKNMACLADGPQALAAGLWAAIRAGWRDAYGLGVTIQSDAAAGETREAIRRSSGCSRFTVRLGRRQAGAFDAAFTPEERGWIIDTVASRVEIEGTTYEIPVEDAEILAVRFGAALKAAGAAHEWIRQTRSAMKTGRSFDLELSLEDGEATAPIELLFCLHWMKARGQAVQLAAPEVADIAHVAELAAVARHYGCNLSIAARPGYTSATRTAIGRATLGRFSYRLPPGQSDVAAAIQEAASDLLA